MIQLTELRKGNFVETSTAWEGYIVVDGIYNGQVCFADGDMFLPKYVEPIPLTEDWLLKFGFEITYSSNFRLKFDHPVHTYIGFDLSHTPDKCMEGLRYYGHYIKVNHVHHLQNLCLDLTGQELDFTPQRPL